MQVDAEKKRPTYDCPAARRWQVGWLPGQKQCDQMARLLFNIWPFATM